ncbi:hypothetical protein SAMN05216431_11521 [Ligilactobacillus sp. WC1T17]|uniref:Nitroreductase domain-containing protein n=1 Tax=Ligilactobacillus ruminis TaxID=1623 RepID=A0ABY1ADW2_9LACO|nr:hypothetical protein SAMN05216431_11521 [Ligilactobacillus ruminis]
MTFNELQKKRHSVYDISKNVFLTKDEIIAMIQEAVRDSPTAFNNQTVRVVITFGESSDKVWDITLEELEKVSASPAAFAKTTAKINTFKAGFGTILFFTETDTVKKMEEAFPLYAANFGDWAEQGLGGAQQAVWETLTEHDLGGSLQHYNPLIDAKISKAFALPKSWKLRAQMPFGAIETPAEAKDKIAVADQFKIFE